MRLRPWHSAVSWILLLVSAGLYTASLFMNVFSIERNLKVFGMGRVEEDPYRLFGAIEALWDEGQIGLAIILTAFSFVFPVSKYLALGFVLLTRDLRWRGRVLGWVKNFGQWSMGDVFVVALLVVIVRVDQGIAQIGVEPRPGLWVFAASVILGLIVSAVLAYEPSPWVRTDPTPEQADAGPSRHDRPSATPGREPRDGSAC